MSNYHVVIENSSKMSAEPVSAFAVYKKTRKAIKSDPSTGIKNGTKKAKFNKKHSTEKKVKKNRNLVEAVIQQQPLRVDYEENHSAPLLIKHDELPIKTKKKSKRALELEKEIRLSKLNKLNKIKQLAAKAKKEKLGNGTTTFDDSCDESKAEEDPSTQALELFKWLIAPMTPENFLQNFWEKKPIHVKRNQPKYYHHIFNSERFDRILRDNPLYYGRNIDVVVYDNGIKQVFNQEGRAVPTALWDYYGNGCSVRLLNPHTYDRKVHLLLATLQEYFGTMVGANVYLTPPGSQGFAPHFDDIEAFVVQLEGRKHWKLYQPNKADFLTRESSGNFDRTQIGEPFMDVTLEEGDLLFFPRGIIHEGRTDEDAHSLHITISVYQKTAYVDLLEKILPEALKIASRNDLEFRKGLPLNYLKHVGAVNASKDSSVKQTMNQTVKKLLKSLVDYVDVDAAADQLGRKFMYDSLPPVLSRSESEVTSKSDGDYMKYGRVYNRVEFELDTKVRLVRYHCLRLVREVGAAPKVYYNTENATVYHGEEEQSLELEEDMVECIIALQKSYPNFVEIESLRLQDDAVKIQLISDLWERGLIVTEEPLPVLDDN